MLVHLYKTPMRARRWYMRLFGYVMDVCISNAWLLYKRDCAALQEKPMPLKHFRLDISRYARCQKSLAPRTARLSSPRDPPHLPKRGQKTSLPHETQLYEPKEWQMPVYVTSRQTCKHCSKKEQVHRTSWMCMVCKVALLRGFPCAAPICVSVCWPSPNSRKSVILIIFLMCNYSESRNCYQRFPCPAPIFVSVC